MTNTNTNLGNVALIRDCEGKPKTGIFTTMAWPLVTVQTIDGGYELSVFSVDVENLPEEVKQQALLIGVKNKIIDTAAIPRDRVTGRSATFPEKISAMNGMVERLANNQWTIGTKKQARVTADEYLTIAISELKNTPMRMAAEWLAGKTKEQKNALRKIESVAVKLAEIMARGESSNDGEELLAELDGLGE